jgi:F0F1-type ATP synthase assembly protein I
VNPKRPDRFLVSAARYTAVAMTLPASTFAGYALGYVLDLWLHTSYLKIVFLILGIASGFVQLIRQLTRDMRTKAEQK